MTKRGGRPTLFTQDLADTICRRLADGESLRRICLASDMPTRETVRTWLRDDQAFRDQHAVARLEQAHALGEEALEAARAATDAASAAVARVRIEAIRWYASKLNPRVYGDKIESTTRHQLVDDNDQPVSVMETARKVAFLLTRAIVESEAGQ